MTAPTKLSNSLADGLLDKGRQWAYLITTINLTQFEWTFIYCDCC